MMKKIFFLIFGLFLSVLVAQSVTAAGPDISISDGWITPANSAAVGTDVIIKYQVKNTPANAVKIQLWISDSKKEERKAIDGTYTFTWKTTGSIAGNHTIAIKEIDVSGATVGSVLHHSYVLTADGSTGTTGTGVTGSDNSFNIADLGTIIWPVNPSVDTPAKLITMIIKLIFGFIAVLAVVAVIYSGIMYMTAGTDQTRAENAKKNLTWAIMGIVIAALAYILVGIIQAVITTVSP